MVQIMARENNEEYETSVPVLIESVRAVLRGMKEGTITQEDLGEISKHTDPKLIEIVTSATVAEVRYTAETLGRFLGMVKPSGEVQTKVYGALGAIELIDAGHLTEASLKITIRDLPKMV